METTIQINCFAGLRKFFGSQLTLSLKLPVPYQQVLQELKKVNPEAGEVLDACRIAVRESFVSPSDIVAGDEPLFIIPPSSGG